MNVKNDRRSPLFWTILAITMVVTLFPIYWMLVTSLKTPVEVISPIPTLIPQIFTMENYISVVSNGFFRHLFNSLLVAASATLLSLALSTLASYALVRHEFPFRANSLFLVWVLVVKILPPVVLAIPLYNVFIQMGLLNSRLGLVFVYQVYTLPYCIWMIFGFLKALPTTFEEAAMIDGAGKLYVLTRIVLPLARTGIIATSIFSVIAAWDEFLFALLFIRTPSLQTLPLVIVNFIGEYETLWGELMGIGLLTTLPVLFFSSYVYKYYTQGFSVSLK